MLTDYRDSGSRTLGESAKMTLFARTSPSHVTAPRSVRKRGFSAIELLIVCAIVGIFATLAYPRVNFTQFQVDSGARTVRVALQNAERLAVTRQYDVVVSFDATNRRVRILEDGNNNDAVDNGERVTYAALEDGVHFKTPPAGLSGPVSNAVNGSNLKTVDGMPTIVFRRDGAASSDLEVYIASSKELANDWRAVQVIQSTGRTDWYRYLAGLWKAGSI
jgi:prepilin-type N-terminal cleavage/methylation domain-containing protein